MYTYRYIMPSGLIQFVNTAINILIMYTDFFVVCLFVLFVFLVVFFAASLQLPLTNSSDYRT